MDSGSASLASFVAGLIAIWTLDPSGLGVYAVFFSAFLAGTYIPRHFVFVPVEMASVQFDREQRKTLVRRSIKVGLWPAVAGSLVIGIAVLASASFADPALLVQLSTTAAIATFLSPIQDHVRRLLHLSDRSWHAALVSVTQLAVVSAIALFALTPAHLLDIAPGWIPFGALVLANTMSLIVGFVLAAGRPRGGVARADLSISSLSKPGRWLLLSALATKGSLFLAAALIGNLAGAEALGYAEAARVVAQPVMVLGIGLADVMSPRMMEAGHRSDLRDGAVGERLFLKVFWALGIAYLLFAATDWAGNVMAHLIPTAYEVAWLAAVSIVANLIVSAVYPYRLELLGGGKERPLALVDVASAAAPLVIAALSGFLLAFARPLGVAGQGAVQMFGYFRTTREMYSSDLGPADATGELSPEGLVYEEPER